MAYQADKLYREVYWIIGKYNTLHQGFLLEETIPIFTKTSVIVSVYQHDYEIGVLQDPLSNVYVLSKFVDYQVYIWENSNNSVKPFPGAKQLVYKTIYRAPTKKVFGNIILENVFDEIPQYDRYRLDVRIVISEPYDNLCESRYVIA